MVLFEHNQTGLTSNFIRVFNPKSQENDLKKILLTENNILFNN